MVISERVSEYQAVPMAKPQQSLVGAHARRYEGNGDYMYLYCTVYLVVPG